MYDGDIASVLITEEDVRAKTGELAQKVAQDYADRCTAPDDLLLVGVLKGAVMFMTDLARAVPLPVQLEFMAVSSYGSATTSSGDPRAGQPSSAAQGTAAHRRRHWRLEAARLRRRRVRRTSRSGPDARGS